MRSHTRYFVAFRYGKVYYHLIGSVRGWSRYSEVNRGWGASGFITRVRPEVLHYLGAQQRRRPAV